MSSKSRKQNPAVSPASKPAVAPAPGHAERKKLVDEDEIIHAPKGQSPIKYALVVVLMIVLLVIFLVPEALFSLGSGGGDGGTYVRYEHPLLGEHELSRREFGLEHDRWDSFFEIQGGLRSRLSAEQVAGILILDALALEYGVRVGDDDVAAYVSVLAAQLGGPENYKALFVRRPGGARGFEETVRAFLRCNQFLALMSFLGSPPVPSRIEELWHDRHREVSFEYVAMPVARFIEAARAAVPEDAELSAWFDAQSAPVRNRYRTQERFSAEQVRLTFDGFDGAKLLERYPAAPDADPEVRAKEYYERVRMPRFRNETPADPTPENLADFKPFQPFEDVREQCLAEAPLYFALLDFSADVYGRQVEGEEVDLAAEAADVGLAHDAGGEPRTHEEWRELGALGGATFANRVARQDPGALTGNVIAEKDSLAIGRLQERIAPAMPPFEELRDEVAETWADERAVQLAMDSLAGLRANLGEGTPNPVVDAAAFDAASEAIELEVQTVDWKDRGDLSNPDAGAPAIETYLRSNYSLYFLDRGEVAEPQPDGARENVFLVRCAGTREVPLDRMKPLDYETFAAQAQRLIEDEFMLESIGLVGQDRAGVPTFDTAMMSELYGLEFTEPLQEGE